jgi:hypothetical protein
MSPWNAVRRWMFAGVCLLPGGCFLQLVGQSPRPAASNAAVLDEALRNSVLVYGNRPFHLKLEITPGTKATSSMRGSVEVFWASAAKYKLVIHSEDFQQTKTVDGAQVEEEDEGDFLPRWLDNFVEAVFEPVPQLQALRQMDAKFTGGGTFQPYPSRPALTMPRYLNKADRPDGITEETSVARVGLDAFGPWIESGLDFTRYVSFRDFEPFGKQRIPRERQNDIPENIFVNGKVTVLEKLSASDAKQIRVEHATEKSGQIRTVFVSREKIGEMLEPLPEYTWPSEDTEALEGYMIVYVRTDRTGRIRESYWDSSDNYKLQDAGVKLALMSRLKPMMVDGAAVQVEGPLVLHFETTRSGEVK